MDNFKTNLDAFSFLSIIYDVESNILNLIKTKLQNFLLSINKLFIDNSWYNNYILKYVNYIFSKKIFPIIISGLVIIKSKLSSFQLISEEYLGINIQNKNKFLLFLLINAFESLIIKYVDKLFSFFYFLYFNRENNIEKITYFSMCVKKIFNHIKNLQNILFGMTFYKMFSPKENKNIFDNIEKPIKLIGYGFIIKDVYNIFQNIKNIFNVYYIEEEKEKKNLDIDNINSHYDEANEKLNLNRIEKDESDDNICLLCLNQCYQICCTPCGHLFCWSCIHLYLSEKNICPKCKLNCKPQEILFLQNYLNI